MYIGIDLGGTNIAAGLTDKNGEIIYADSLPTIKERRPDEIIADMAKLAVRVTEKGGYRMSDVDAVGIGSPGTIDNSKGVVVYSNNIVMDNVPMAEIFQRHIDLPVNIENDANAAAYGEYFACGEKCSSFVFMTLGTGVGGGIIIDGKIYRGFNGAGAEIGHSSIVRNGKLCTCGRRGCLEAYASVSALIEQTREKMKICPDSMMNKYAAEKGEINGKTAFDCAELGDRAAMDVRDEYIGYVAEGVTNLVNIFQPELFVIGGGISRQGDVLLNPIKKYVRKNDYNKHMPKTKIRTAKLFGDAGIVGAAMAAAEKIDK